MLRFVLLVFLFAQLVKGQGCDRDPCVHGECTTETEDGSPFSCICEENWTGIKCNLPQPEIICGNKTIEIFIDKRIVTEQGLPGSPEFIHFMNAPGCAAEEKNGGYHLKTVFKECGLIITHEGDDYTYHQQIVWNRLVEFVERPLVLLEFKCSYQDKYTVSYGEITPFVTTVDFETSYGVFKVDMSLYKSSSFEEEDKYGARPVVSIEDKVCVSTELKNVMLKHLVLTNRDCWASTEQDGSGDSHYLLSGKCKDDPTTQILSNGEGDLARFCFQMFKWKDSMEEVYMHCVVNVCNATAFPDYCQCQNERSKRFARSLTTDSNGARITYGPVYLKPAGWDENELVNDVIFETDQFYNPSERGDSDRGNDAKTTILIAVGVVLVISLILLGVVVAVYINCRRRSRDPKTHLRSEGEPVVIPNPSNHDATLN